MLDVTLILYRTLPVQHFQKGQAVFRLEDCVTCSSKECFSAYMGTTFISRFCSQYVLKHPGSHQKHMEEKIHMAHLTQTGQIYSFPLFGQVNVSVVPAIWSGNIHCGYRCQ